MDTTGTAESLAADSADLLGLSEAVTALAAALVMTTSGLDWTGPAADEFRSRLDEAVHLLQASAGRFDAAGCEARCAAQLAAESAGT